MNEKICKTCGEEKDWNTGHIVPQSNLKYISMDSNEFRQCRALSNLRPYSAKQNFVDGIYRVRHKGSVV